MAKTTLEFVQGKSKAASVKNKDALSPSSKTLADVTPMPRRAVQGPAMLSKSPDRNQEYVSAGDVIRKQMEFIEAAFNAVASSPNTGTRKYAHSTMLMSVIFCMGDLALSLDEENIKVRYPYSIKQK